MTKVPVYDESGKYVTTATYNEDLDIWDGDRFCIGYGLHLGITKLRDGRYALIYGEEDPGGEKKAEVVSDRMAMTAIIYSGHEDMLDEPRYARLGTLFENEGLGAMCSDTLSKKVRLLHNKIDKRRSTDGTTAVGQMQGTV